MPPTENEVAEREALLAEISALVENMTQEELDIFNMLISYINKSKSDDSQQ